MAEEKITQPVTDPVATTKIMHPHPFAYLVYYLGGLFISVVGYQYGYIYAIVGVFVLIVGEVMRRSETLTLSEEGIARNFTMLARTQAFTSYTMIRNFMVTQSAYERFLGLGTITFITSDTEEGKIQFSGVRNPYAVGEIIQAHLARV